MVQEINYGTWLSLPQYIICVETMKANLNCQRDLSPAGIAKAAGCRDNFMIVVTIAGKSFEIELGGQLQINKEFNVLIDGQTITVRLSDSRINNEDSEWLIIDGRPYEISVDRDFGWIKTNAGLYPIEVRDRNEALVRPRSGDGRIKAPIPGLIKRVLISEGDEVKAGQPLLVLEAMKMENEIRAPHHGRVKTINVIHGQAVSQNEILTEIA
jgi:biotin carboxyl carrier protein